MGRFKKNTILTSAFIVILLAVAAKYSFNGGNESFETDKTAAKLEAPDQVPADSVSELRRRSLEGDAEAQVKMGDLYFDGEGVSQQYAEAVRWYRQAAEQGLAEGQFKIGKMHEAGLGVELSEEEALKWYKMAADQGFADGQASMGYMYLTGTGVTLNPAVALKWLKMAAAQGSARAQNNIGAMYSDGLGIQQDYAEALKWYKRAAEQGFVDAQSNIGFVYENGEGVVPNQAEAIKWYKLAAGQGNKFAKSRLDVLEPAGGTPQGMSGQICQGYSFVIPQAIIFRGQGLPLDVALQITDSSYDLSPRLFDFLNYMVKTAYEDPEAATEMLRSGKFLELCTQHVQGF